MPDIDRNVLFCVTAKRLGSVITQIPEREVTVMTFERAALKCDWQEDLWTFLSSIRLAAEPRGRCLAHAGYGGAR